MSEDARQTTGPREPDAAFDAIGALATALACYLDEVHADAAVCERHEGTARLHVTRRTLHLRKTFPWVPDAAVCLEHTAAALPAWERSLYWQWVREACVSLKHDAARGKGGGAAGEPFLCRGVAWEGRAALVCAFGSQTEGRLDLEVMLPHVPAVPPELPLLAVASGLRCHEHLLPQRIVPPLAPAVPSRPYSSPLAFLTRAMPPNLYASQWISQLGAAP